MEQEGSPWLLLAMSGFVILALAVISILATRRLQKIPQTTTQGLVELVVSSLNNFVVGIIGPGGEKYTPFIGSIFIYVLSMNLLGLVPGFKAPTSSLSITIAMALTVFVMYNYYGMREVGAVKYLKHLLGEPLWLAPLMLPIHIIGELARPLSLSIRLFGNIFGEETILVILAGMSFALWRIHGIPVVALPYQFPMMVFAVFTSFVQALVFTMLSTIYISIAVSHEEAHA
ncbi:MAG TPA: F0F1 ATP synthase subunit A [Armatimonadota bacterium]|nr:F0F1 ATP synthase subunit A [Armatimonadota bacterium]